MTYAYISRSKTRTTCRLDDDFLHVVSVNKKGLSTEHRISYQDIQRIHLSLPDVEWHSIDIHHQWKRPIHLKSITFFIPTADGTLRRPKLVPEDNAVVRHNKQAYHAFVHALHDRLARKNKGIRYTCGSSWLKILIWAALILITILLPIMWAANNYRTTWLLGGAFLFLLLFSLKINFNRSYNPATIPSKYLPILN